MKRKIREGKDENGRKSNKTGREKAMDIRGSRDSRGLTDPHGLMGWVVAGTGTGLDAPTCQFSNEPKNSPNT